MPHLTCAFSVSRCLARLVPTGLMLNELRTRRPRRIRYYRSDSAASRLSPADADRAAQAITDADVLHLTGITSALGPQPRAALTRAMEIARDGGSLGPVTAVVKLGALGAVVAHKGTLTHAPASPIGAGDTFAGSYLAEHLRGLSPDECLRTGNALGAAMSAPEGD